MWPGHRRWTMGNRKLLENIISIAYSLAPFAEGVYYFFIIVVSLWDLV